MDDEEEYEDLARVTFWKALNDPVFETAQTIADLTGERDSLQAEVESLNEEFRDIKKQIMEHVVAHAISVSLGARSVKTYEGKFAVEVAEILGLNVKDFGFVES